MCKALSLFAFAVLCIQSLGPSALADDWTRFRGVNGTGASDSTTLPTTWSDSENIAWKIELPGHGSSSPVVTGDRIFVTYYSGYGIGRDGSTDQLIRHLICVDGKQGEILWDKTVSAGNREDPYQGYISEHGYASNSATTDGTHVFVFHGKSGVFAYDMDGQELWNHSVGRESSNRQWGSAASLTLVGNKLIVNASEEGRAVIALDKKTGKDLWKAEASTLELSYGTPAIVNRDDGKTVLVLSVPGEVWGLNSETGKLSWFVETQLTGNISPSPLIIDQCIYVFGGYRSTGSYRIRSGGTGDITKSHVDWYSRSSSYVATPVHHDGRLYWIDDQGIAWCQEASSGKQVYRERVQQLRAGGRPVYASPIVADGKLYIVTRHDGTLIIPATTEFTVESHNVLTSDETDFNATPAVYDNQLLLRSNHALYCIKSASDN
jgi:outer membrane protein assembly factor BamB